MVVCGKTCAGFRDFLLRGNVVDIAVGIVIGAAFKDVVDGLVADLITPLIAVAGGMPDFSEASFTIRGSEFKYGHFVNTIISFIVLSAVVYFLVVIPTQKLIASMMAKKSDGNRPCESCLEAVPRDAKVCKFCCRDLPPPPPIPVEEQRSELRWCARSSFLFCLWLVCVIISPALTSLSEFSAILCSLLQRECSAWWPIR